MKIVYKKSLYKHHASLNYYRSNIINFEYLSYKIHMFVVHSNSLGGINVFSTGLSSVFSPCSLLLMVKYKNNIYYHFIM